MQYLIGFVIALFIALTGVGAGTVTVPVLILFLGVPAPVAVGIGLMFATAVKLILVPTQIARRNVAWRTLGFMLLGGAPGVIVGSLFLETFGQRRIAEPDECAAGHDSRNYLSLADLCFIPPAQAECGPRDRSYLLAGLMFPVGAEVGFSSAGAGALGSAALLSLTTLLPAQVVGTDIAFGFAVSLIGSGAHWFSHASNPELLIHLIVGGVGGAIVGTLASTHVPRRQLRFALCVWLLILGGQFLFNSYAAWAAPTKVAASQSQTAPSR